MEVGIDAVYFEIWLLNLLSNYSYLQWLCFLNSHLVLCVSVASGYCFSWIFRTQHVVSDSLASGIVNLALCLNVIESVYTELMLQLSMSTEEKIISTSHRWKCRLVTEEPLSETALGVSNDALHFMYLVCTGTQSYYSLILRPELILKWWHRTMIKSEINWIRVGSIRTDLLFFYATRFLLGSIVSANFSTFRCR